MLVEERGERRKRLVTPPDGGWGWVVVFASFMIHVIADGIAYSFGLFFVGISKEFEGSKSAASWIESILFGVTFGTGPIASAFVNRFGCRAVCIAGSIVACFGFGISHWATSYAFLYVSVGLVGGLGLGLMYLPAIVCVSCYFEKKRAFATGIAVCGSGFGNFLLALIFDPLIQRIGWRASLLVVSLMLLACIIFAAMFRPVEEHIEDFPNPNYEMENDKHFGSSSGNNDTYLMSSTGDLRGPIKASPAHNLGINPKGSIEMLPLKYLRDDNDGSISSLRRVDSLEEIALKTDSIISESHYEGDLVTPHRGVITSRKDVFFSGSVSHIPDLIPDERGVTTEDYSRPASSIANYEQQRLSSRRCSEQTLNKSNSYCSRFFSPEFRAGLKTMMDFSLLAEPIFLYFAISNFLTNVGYNVPYIYLADMSKDHLNVRDDNDPSLGIIVSSIGIANTISRLVLGYISDKKCVNRLYVYATSLTICGFATGLAAHGFSLPSLAFCAALFGATGGIYVGLTPVVLVDLLGLDRLSNAFGIVLMFQGVGTLLGPPIVGLLHDHFKNYIFGFWLAGITTTISGSMLFLIPCIKRRGSKRPRNLLAVDSPYAISNDNNRDALIT